MGLDGFDDLERALGMTAAIRVADAFAEALWREARASDDIQALDGGRVHLSLDCDQAGAEAFAERAASSVRPWLNALPVPLSIAISGDAASVEPLLRSGPRPH
jgi:hypothetical protein